MGWLRGWRVHEGVVRAMYTTEELTKETWPDFERLFSQGNGWDFCWCMHFQRLRALPRNQWRTRAERGARNRKQKKELVDEGHAHGILVYANGEPVGWCQYGRSEELPRGSTTTAVITRWAWKGRQRSSGELPASLRTRNTAVAVWRVQR